MQSSVVASCTLFPFVEVRNARRGSQNLRASNLVATQSADPTYLALIHLCSIDMYTNMFVYTRECVSIRICTCLHMRVSYVQAWMPSMQETPLCDAGSLMRWQQFRPPAEARTEDAKGCLQDR